ncbi:MAG: GAF domain-containing protein [Acidimicrobiia bacterium]
METTLEALREQIRREERVAGLRADGYVSDDQIRVRRRQLAVVAALVFLFLAFATMANDVWTSVRRESFVDPELLRLVAIALAIGFVAYTFEKERHLKLLGRLGREVRDVDRELARRLVGRAAVADAMQRIGASLELDAVLDATLDQAMALVGAARGSIVLLVGGDLRPAMVRNFGERGGTPLLLDEHVVLRAVMAGEPVSLDGSVPLDPASIAGGPVTSVVCVPLAAGGKPLGALTVGAVVGEHFDAATVDVLRELAECAALPVAHARRFEQVVMLLEQETDLVAASDQLHHLAAVIADGVSALRAEQLGPRRRAATLDRIGASGSQLLKLADGLLATEVGDGARTPSDHQAR